MRSDTEYAKKLAKRLCRYYELDLRDDGNAIFAFANIKSGKWFPGYMNSTMDWKSVLLGDDTLNQHIIEESSMYLSVKKLSKSSSLSLLLRSLTSSYRFLVRIMTDFPFK